MQISETFSKLVVGVAAALLLAVGSTAQTCSDPGLRSVLRVLSEYSDVTATCEVLRLEDQEIDYVKLVYDAHPGVQSFVSSNYALLRWKVYLTPAHVDVYALLRDVERNPSLFYDFDFFSCLFNYFSI